MRLIPARAKSVQTWTPALTFATPGNLAVTYSRQLGWLYLDADWAEAVFTLTTATFTHTTASGNLLLNGLSSLITPKTLTDAVWSGSLSTIRGITKANFTQFHPRIDSANATILIIASGSGQSPAAIAFGDVPTGGTVTLMGQIRFPRP